MGKTYRKNTDSFERKKNNRRFEKSSTKNKNIPAKFNKNRPLEIEED